MPTVTAGRLLRPIERLYDALTDPVRRERAMAFALCGYAVAWALYGAIAKSSQDIHFDMGEAVAWSREPALGTPKHPPMSAWLVRIWFTFFPLADWAYYLLAIVLATLALWIAWRIAADYLDPEKRVVGLALLTLLPFFNFHALKYNANTVLIPFWAAATWWFLRSFETRSLIYAALAGLGAAGAMLGKYWSIFLLAGLGAAALADPRRGGYFRSAAPWVTVGVGALALAPHAAWIVANDFSSFGYALTVHASTSALTPLKEAIGFLIGTAAYMAIPVALAFAAARPSLRAVADTLWPRDPKRRLVLIAFAAPILLPVLVAVIAQFGIVSLWNMSAMTLLPVVLLSSPLVTVPRWAAVRILALAVVFPVVMILASPVIAIAIHRQGVDHSATHYRLLAAAIDEAWRKAVPDKPMRLVGSYTNLVNGVVFYLADRPSTLDVGGPAATPWATEARIAREGVALVCPAADAGCMRLIEAHAAKDAAAKRSEVELSRRYAGRNDPPGRYVIIIIPPRAD
jgi:4-amino-4-deoxy-L-arabinose transferase-like glycosyltransferase